MLTLIITNSQPAIVLYFTDHYIFHLNHDEAVIEMHNCLRLRFTEREVICHISNNSLSAGLSEMSE